MHSLALIISDFSKLPPISTAIAVVDEICEAFDQPELARQLHDLQVAAGVGPLKLLQPIVTRIGVYFVCFERLKLLKSYIIVVGDAPKITSTRWVRSFFAVACAPCILIRVNQF